MSSKTNPSNLKHIKRLRESILEKDKMIRLLYDLTLDLTDQISELNKKIINQNELNDNSN